MELDAHSLNAKTSGDFADKLRRFKGALVEVEDSFAFRTDEVMMRFGRWIDPERTMMQTHLSHDATFNERVQRLVYRRQRDAGNLLADDVVHLFRTGMPRRGHQRLVNDSTLMRDGKTVTLAQTAKISRLTVLLHL